MPQSWPAHDWFKPPVGEAWQNDRGRVLWQWRCSFANSCGRCIEMANAIGRWWPLPLHRGCVCENVAIVPGDRSAPGLDYREEVRRLDPAQQARVIGRAKLQLVEAGLVEWGQVVERTRIKTLRQVIDERGLTAEQLRGAGVAPATIRAALADLGTPIAELADRRRMALVAALEGRGLTREQLRTELGRRLAARVGVAGPGGSGGSPPGPVGPPPPAPAPKPEPARPETPLERHRRLIAEAEARQSERFPAPAMPEGLDALRREIASTRAELAEARRERRAVRIVGLEGELERLESRAAALQSSARVAGRVPDGPIAGRIAQDEVAEAKRQAIVELGRELKADLARANADVEAATRDLIRAREMEDNSGLLAAKGKHAEAREVGREAERLREEARARREEARARRERLESDRGRRVVLEVLGQAAPQEVAADTAGGVRSTFGVELLRPDARQRAKIDEAARFVSRLVRSGGGAVEMRLGVIPDGARAERAKGDAHYFHRTRYIQLDPHESVGVIVHEMGHAVEYQVPAGSRTLKDLAAEFLAHRTAGKPAVRLAEVRPGAGFADYEVTKDGGFRAALGEHRGWYASKQYKDGATELISIGLEQLYNDPMPLIEKDPEYARFLIGILGGTLR